MPTQFAKMIGAAVPTVKSWLAGQGAPSIDRLPKIDAVADGFFRDLAAELGYLAHRIDGNGPCPNKHATALAAALTELNRALEDRQIDHTEAPALAPIFLKLASESAAFAADLSKRAA